MKKNFFKDISASTLQVSLNQAVGLVIFIILSRYLAKDIYGEFNWSLALLTFITTILSLRLEQIVVRKIASGDNPSKLFTLFTGHTVFFGILFYLLLFLASITFSNFFDKHNLLLIVAISQILILFSLPSKQIANGKESFRLLALMSSVSNMIKFAALLSIILLSFLTIQQVLVIYIFSAFAELVTGLYLVRTRLGISITLPGTLKAYGILINESLPQMGVVLLNACIARLDWILLGIFSTRIITAEYSFAYKIFELCPFPMLVIAPVLLTRLARYFNTHTEHSLVERKKELGFYFRYAMIAATLLPLILNIVWTPLIGSITDNKYGVDNKTVFFLLSLCLPFQYMINFLWTIKFAQNHLKLIFRITAVTCSIILVGDLFMIPLLNAKGAAIVYLFATVTEYLIYLRYSLIVKLKESWQSLLICTGNALLSGFLVQYIADSVFLKLILSVFIYTGGLLLTRQIKKTDLLIWNEWK